MTYYANQRLSTANTLTHHGVKGMKWGVRKDAKKAVIAKYSHGDGAGTLRKQAKASYELKVKKYGNEYAKEYSKYYDQYDTERSRKKADRRSKAKKTYKEAKSLTWRATTGLGRAAASTAKIASSVAVIGSLAYSASPQVRNAMHAIARKYGAYRIRKAMGG